MMEAPDEILKDLARSQTDEDIRRNLNRLIQPWSAFGGIATDALAGCQESLKFLKQQGWELITPWNTVA
jgi:hypothetical protein